jgi:hypothetical protein
VVVVSSRSSFVRDVASFVVIVVVVERERELGVVTVMLT